MLLCGADGVFVRFGREGELSRFRGQRPVARLYPAVAGQDADQTNFLAVGAGQMDDGWWRAVQLDGDGVEFTVTLDPVATLENNTDLGFNVGYALKALYAYAEYNLVFVDGKYEIGPVWENSNTYPVTTNHPSIV